jgi:iron complex transport system substrate-binding protein
MRKKYSLVLILFLLSSYRLLAFQAPQRIITLSSALSETADALGFGNRIVATDVTSEYPAYIKKLPRVSRNRQLSVEGLMQYRPDLVLAPEGDIPKAIAYQLQKAGIKLVTFRQQFSVAGADKLIREVAAALGVAAKGDALAKQTMAGIKAVQQQVSSNKQKTLRVLFIYARGAGTMSVAGKGSNMDAIITLAGARNAVQEFADFKPYSTEALIKANPDVILLFDFGAASLGGRTAILKMPGITLTNAGKQKRIVEVDGPLMVNFSTRLPDAMQDLYQKLQ